MNYEARRETADQGKKLTCDGAVTGREHAVRRRGLRLVTGVEAGAVALASIRLTHTEKCIASINHVKIQVQLLTCCNTAMCTTATGGNPCLHCMSSPRPLLI
jgi:hypothetical protein